MSINATEGTNLIEETFLKHPRNRGHRCRLHWKHHFRKLAIEQALKLDGDFETNFFEALDELTVGFHPAWIYELHLFNIGKVTKDWALKCLKS